MRGSDFIFDCVNLLYYKCHKINFKRGGSYIDSRDSIKNKEATINPINKKIIFFQHAVTAALNHEKIKKSQKKQKNKKNESLLYKSNWEGIKHSSEKDDWKEN